MGNELPSDPASGADGGPAEVHWIKGCDPRLAANHAFRSNASQVVLWAGNLERGHGRGGSFGLYLPQMLWKGAVQQDRPGRQGTKFPLEVRVNLGARRDNVPKQEFVFEII
jgi:hypothetical protein